MEDAAVSRDAEMEGGESRVSLVDTGGKTVRRGSIQTEGPGAARAGTSRQTRPCRPQKGREVGRLDPGRLDLSEGTGAKS